jgi:hypothetical protein
MAADLGRVKSSYLARTAWTSRKERERMLKRYKIGATEFSIYWSVWILMFSGLEWNLATFIY